MKKTLSYLFTLLLLTATFLTGCASKASAPYPERYVEKGVIQQEAPLAPAEAMESEADNFVDTPNSGSVDRIVIKNADLSIVVKNPGESMATIGQMAEGMGGYIVNSQLYKTTTDEGTEVPVADITVRVPAEKLNEALNRIKILVDDPKTDVLSESVSGQDVTKEYTDLQSRLRNLQNAEAQLKEIMKQASKTEDVLNTYNELTRVEEQIEVIKGQIKYYDEASQLSSVHISIQSQESIKPLNIGGWQPVGVARDALQALINAFKFLANAAIWGVIFCLPVVIVVGVPVWFIIKGIRQWTKRRKTPKQVDTSPKNEA